MSKNVRNLSARHGLDNKLFDRLAEARSEEKGLDQEVMHQVADEYLIGNANVYGAATFYDFLNPEQSNKKVFVCAGSACMLAGTQPALHHTLEQHFDPATIGEVYCLGRCYENHAFHYHGFNYSGRAAAQIAELKAGSITTIADQYTVGSLGKGLLTALYPSLEQTLKTLIQLLESDPEQLLEEISISGLRGRGGAGFPLAIKLAGVKKENADEKYIVCNADEGDPGAFSDRYLLEQKAHLVLFGMAISGYISGAQDGVLYIRAEYPEAISILHQAIEPFNRIFPHQKRNGDIVNFKLHVVKAQGAYICGEETALLSSLEGLRPEVRTRPPFPTQSGLFGKPTSVNNVETLANVYAILSDGGSAFKAIGTAKSAGTKLLSLDSHFNNPGLYEVDMGTPLSAVINELGGGMKEPIKAFHIGGPLGGLVPLHKIAELTIDFESFASQGFLLGHASILSIPTRFPLLEYLEHLFAFTAHESCGKCFPCRIGSVRGKELLQKARAGNYQIDRELWDDLIDKYLDRIKYHKGMAQN